MLSTALRNPVRKLSLLVLGVLAAALAPFTPARAAVEVPVELPISYQGVFLSALYGSITFHSDTRFSYSLVMCRGSSFTPPHTEFSINGVFYDDWQYGAPNVQDSRCPGSAALRAVDVERGSTVQNVRLTLRASHFNGQTGVFTPRERSATYDNPLN